MKIFVVLAVAFLSVTCRHYGKPDFYWRDFNGTIPKDAFKVFFNGSDVPVYIGQGYFHGVGLLPGMLQDGVMEMSVASKRQTYTITSSIKIMATDTEHPELDFQWIPITYDDLGSMLSLKFLNIPIGGSTSGHGVYIGRHSDSSTSNIGQVSTITPYLGLNIPNPKGSHQAPGSSNTRLPKNHAKTPVIAPTARPAPPHQHQGTKFIEHFGTRIPGQLKYLYSPRCSNRSHAP